MDFIGEEIKQKVTVDEYKKSHHNPRYNLNHKTSSVREDAEYSDQGLYRRNIHSQCIP